MLRCSVSVPGDISGNFSRGVMAATNIMPRRGEGTPAKKPTTRANETTLNRGSPSAIECKSNRHARTMMIKGAIMTHARKVGRAMRRKAAGIYGTRKAAYDHIERS